MDYTFKAGERIGYSLTMSVSKGLVLAQRGTLGKVKKGNPYFHYIVNSELKTKHKLEKIIHKYNVYIEFGTSEFS